MPSVAEITAGSATGLEAVVKAGVQLVSGSQSITFVKYNRFILPADGFVFWVAAALTDSTVKPLTVKCSLHLHSDKVQEDSTTYTRNQIIATSEQDLSQEFNALGATSIYIGSYKGTRFAFGKLSYYQNANVFHYAGIAILPVMNSQIIDTLTGFDETSPVMNNSIPAWLLISGTQSAPYAPFYGFGNPFPIYPAKLSLPDLVPPYITVEVRENSTRALGSVPHLGKTSSHYQLCSEKVKVTTYGLRAAEVLTLMDCIIQYMQDYSILGLMNCPVFQDERMGQTELSMLAQKKSAEFEVSYLQKSIRDIARQLIVEAVPTYILKWPSSWYS